MSLARIERSNIRKTVSELIGSNPEDTLIKFEANRDNNNAANSPKLQIPTHQRFYVWPQKNWSNLIDSIMCNFPLPLMVFTNEMVATDEIKNGKRVCKNFWYIQDGQQRLITLQQFILGKFPWEKFDGTPVYFKDLSDAERNQFLNFELSFELVDDPTLEQVACIFERLNCGKPLTDNDKFWNRRETQIIKFILEELVEHAELKEYFKMYVTGKTKIASGKSRKNLSDIVGATIAIVRNSFSCITTSFDKIGSYVCDPITAEKKRVVIDVFKYYFEIIHESMTSKSIKCPLKKYIKLSDMLGLFLFWILHPDYYDAIEDDEHALSIHEKYWETFAWRMQHKTFKVEYFSILSAGARQNIDTGALKQKLDYLLHDSTFISTKQPPLIDFIEEPDEEESTDSDDAEN
jgi:hypothetical protein